MKKVLFALVGLLLATSAFAQYGQPQGPQYTWPKDQALRGMMSGGLSSLSTPGYPGVTSLELVNATPTGQHGAAWNSIVSGGTVPSVQVSPDGQPHPARFYFSFYGNWGWDPDGAATPANVPDTVTLTFTDTTVPPSETQLSLWVCGHSTDVNNPMPDFRYIGEYCEPIQVTSSTPIVTTGTQFYDITKIVPREVIGYLNGGGDEMIKADWTTTPNSILANREVVMPQRVQEFDAIDVTFCGYVSLAAQTAGTKICQTERKYYYEIFVPEGVGSSVNWYRVTNIKFYAYGNNLSTMITKFYWQLDSQLSVMANPPFGPGFIPQTSSGSSTGGVSYPASLNAQFTTQMALGNLFNLGCLDPLGCGVTIPNGLRNGQELTIRNSNTSDYPLIFTTSGVMVVASSPKLIAYNKMITFVWQNSRWVDKVIFDITPGAGWLYTQTNDALTFGTNATDNKLNCCNGNGASGYSSLSFTPNASNVTIANTVIADPAASSDPQSFGEWKMGRQTTIPPDLIYWSLYNAVGNKFNSIIDIRHPRIHEYTAEGNRRGAADFEGASGFLHSPSIQSNGTFGDPNDGLIAGGGFYNCQGFQAGTGFYDATFQSRLGLDFCIPYNSGGDIPYNIMTGGMIVSANGGNKMVGMSVLEDTYTYKDTIETTGGAVNMSTFEELAGSGASFTLTANGNVSLTTTATGPSVPKITTSPTTSMVLYDVELDQNGAKPTCDAANRGRLWFTRAATLVADTLEVCRKDNADAYAWVALY